MIFLGNHQGDLIKNDEKKTDFSNKKYGFFFV